MQQQQQQRGKNKKGIDWQKVAAKVNSCQHRVSCRMRMQLLLLFYKESGRERERSGRERKEENICVMLYANACDRKPFAATAKMWQQRRDNDNKAGSFRLSGCSASIPLPTPNYLSLSLSSAKRTGNFLTYAFMCELLVLVSLREDER